MIVSHSDLIIRNFVPHLSGLLMQYLSILLYAIIYGAEVKTIYSTVYMLHLKGHLLILSFIFCTVQNIAVFYSNVSGANFNGLSSGTFLFS